MSAIYVQRAVWWAGENRRGHVYRGLAISADRLGDVLSFIQADGRQFVGPIWDYKLIPDDGVMKFAQEDAEELEGE